MGAKAKREREELYFTVFVVLVVLVSIFLVPVFGTIEEVEVTPTNTNGVELGELSFMQFVLFAIIFLKLVTLYTVGVLPLEIDLGAFVDKFFNFTTTGRGFVDSEAELSTYFLDCPLQFVCDVDAWASRDHEYFAERLIASWFRHPNHTWQHENAGIYAGRGTCREMYPCPFDVQEVVGIRIPGSQRIASGGNDLNVDDSYSFF
ncbi:uncharacterized protein [Macrobrachium rosenbergii]|uniref:uncharacterized protein isoform X1 n=1 Tax=Macrobrachium rosenbergii TaxID=79674 RepID=UPI0034D74CD7